MNYCVAIRANRTEVFDWVYNVGRTDACERDNVMDVNKVLSTFAVPRLKVEAANEAAVTVVVNACLPSKCTALVSVYSHLSLCALNNRFGDFIGVRHVKQMAS